jgi:hypothetical protein
VGEGAADDAYLSALDAFVDGDGNRLLTDTSVNPLHGMDNDLVWASQFADGDFTVAMQDVARYTERDLSHPLLTDVRPIQNQLCKVAPLGYAVTGGAPNHLVSEAAFTAGPAVSSVAGRTGGAVATGSLTHVPDDGTGIHVVGSLLPPASQADLHPFGLLDYTVSYLGYLVFTSALGFQQVRVVAGDEMELGADNDFDIGAGAVGDTLTASGTRSDGGTVDRTGGTNHVEVTLDSVSADGPATVVDGFDPAWSVASMGDAVAVNEANGTITFEGVTASDTVEYFLEAPSSPGQFTFGPAHVELDGSTARRRSSAGRATKSSPARTVWADRSGSSRCSAGPRRSVRWGPVPSPVSS